MLFFQERQFMSSPYSPCLCPSTNVTEWNCEGQNGVIFPAQVISVSQFTAAAQSVVQVSYDQREKMAQLLQTGFERKAIVLWNYMLRWREKEREM